MEPHLQPTVRVLSEKFSALSEPLSKVRNYGDIRWILRQRMGLNAEQAQQELFKAFVLVAWGVSEMSRAGFFG